MKFSTPDVDEEGVELVTVGGGDIRVALALRLGLLVEERRVECQTRRSRGSRICAGGGGGGGRTSVMS